MQDNNNSNLSSKLIAMSGEENWWLKSSKRFRENRDEERWPLEESQEKEKEKAKEEKEATRSIEITSVKNKTHKNIVINIGKLFAAFALIILLNHLIAYQIDRVSV